MKKFCWICLLLLYGCHGVVVPESFVYKEIQTNTYKLATWQKLSNKTGPIHVYIEGDGYAFNHQGYPSTNPTPRGAFLRNIAFNDPNDNVVYLARPCQYVDDPHCSVKDWTTGRFSQEIVDSTSTAIKDISGKQSIILVGYSGGALLSGLVIAQTPNLPVKKWITLAGLLNHHKWTENLKLLPLVDSVDLDALPDVEQLHLVGDKDKIIPWKLTESIVNKEDLIVIPKATHTSGYDEYYPIIYQ